MNRQMKNVHGVHVAVTRHGIRKDCNRFPFGSIFRTTTIVRSCASLMLPATLFADLSCLSHHSLYVSIDAL